MRRLQLIGSSIAFILIFLWGYKATVVPIYSYAGFIFRWPGLEPIAWAIVLCLIPLSIIPMDLSKPSVLVLWWLYVTAYVPSLLMPTITLAIPESTAFPLQLSVLCAMLMLCSVPYSRTLVLPSVSMPGTHFWWILGLAWGGCILFSLNSISPSRVLANIAVLFAGRGSEYLIRADFAEQVSQTGRALGYIGRELAEALDPFLIAYGVISKRWWMLAAGLFGQLVYLGQTGMKEVPFSILLMFLVWFLYRKFRRRFGFAFLATVTVLILICTSIDLATNGGALSTLFTRRALAGPGLLTGFNFEHYSIVAHPGHSFSGTGSAQLVGPPQEIGLYYFGSANIDANANFWAEGFAEYGVPGIFAFGLLVALALWIYDSIAVRGSLELAILLAVVQADALSNSSPLTVLVTHGGLLAGMLLYFAPAFSRPTTTKSDFDGSLQPEPAGPSLYSVAEPRESTRHLL